MCTSPLLKAGSLTDRSIVDRTEARTERTIEVRASSYWAGDAPLSRVAPGGKDVAPSFNLPGQGRSHGPKRSDCYRKHTLHCQAILLPRADGLAHLSPSRGGVGGPPSRDGGGHRWSARIRLAGDPTPCAPALLRGHRAALGAPPGRNPSLPIHPFRALRGTRAPSGPGPSPGASTATSRAAPC